MFFLFGPFLFFSDFGTFAAFNPVLQSSFEININVGQGVSYNEYNQTFNLYKSRNSIVYTTNDVEYNNNHFGVMPPTKAYDRQ